MKDGTVDKREGIEAIRVISTEAGTPYVPPSSDYESASEDWRETEYHCFRDPTERVLCGFWKGEPGEVRLGPWPYDEICILLKGRVAVLDEDGNRREFAAPEAFVVPRTFSGSWETIEAAEKIFIAVSTPSRRPT